MRQTSPIYCYRFIIPPASFHKYSICKFDFNSDLVLGAKFNLTEISRMWLKEKGVSTLSYLLSDAKFYIPKTELLYVAQIQKMYKPEAKQVSPCGA